MFASGRQMFSQFVRVILLCSQSQRGGRAAGHWVLQSRTAKLAATAEDVVEYGPRQLAVLGAVRDELADARQQLEQRTAALQDASQSIATR